MITLQKLSGQVYTFAVACSQSSRRMDDDEMGLELKNQCEKCGAALTPGGIAYMCSYECSYCESCAGEMNFVCANCEGELLRRPRRKERTNSVALGDA